MSPALAALNETIRALGGTVTSVPGAWPVRFAVEPTQAEGLTELLHKAGWTPSPRGSTTRIEGGGFFDVLMYEVAKPKER